MAAPSSPCYIVRSSLSVEFRKPFPYEWYLWEKTYVLRPPTIEMTESPWMGMRMTMYPKPLLVLYCEGVLKEQAWAAVLRYTEKGVTTRSRL